MSLPVVTFQDDLRREVVRAARRWSAAVLLAAAVSVLAHRRHALTFDGAVAALVVGSVAFGRAGLPGAGAMLAFFVSSSALSRVREARQQRGALAQAKGSRRDAWQVLANGGVATVCALCGWPAGFLGALATAAADTWATELGLLLGGNPRLITTLERVEAGTSGGVTPGGLAASIGGAALVGAGWRVCGGDAAPARASVLAGVAGALADSLLGATVQALYRCQSCGALVEAPAGHETVRLRGHAWIDNDVVNALATAAGGAAAGGLVWYRRRTRRGR